MDCVLRSSMGHYPPNPRGSDGPTGVQPAKSHSGRGRDTRVNRPVFWWVLGLMLLVAGAVQAAPSREARATVVVYNASDPSSFALAKYYAMRREIPENNLVGLPCAATEEISRQEFQTTLAGPLRKAFVDRGWWRVEGGRVSESRIRFVALMRGIPLKVRSEGASVPPRTDQPAAIGKRDEASVDAELACLGLGNVPTAGLVPNSYFRRFTGILEAIADPGLLLVCRLDAPTEITVRGMIDEALSAERDGLWGWAYVDSRNIKTGGYAEGDEWLGAAAVAMRRQGIPVLWDKAPETLPAGYPVTDAAVYFGWYAGTVNGPFADPAFRFRNGAVAVHIHSFSAATLRDPNRGWCAPLLERGAAATLGNVYEPYLSLTAHLDVFQDRLAAGFTLAESAYMATRALSWMTVVVGDPLYRPYARWQDLTKEPVYPSNWERYRQIIRNADGDILRAAPELAQAAAESGNSLFLESLGAAQADAGEFPAALKSVDQALKLDNKPLVRFRLILEKFGLLRVLGKKSEAGALLLSEQTRSPGPAQTALLAEMGRRLFPPTPNPPAAKK